VGDKPITGSDNGLNEFGFTRIVPEVGPELLHRGIDPVHHFHVLIVFPKARSDLVARDQLAWAREE
jgi:hypothetical protein